MKSSIPKFFNFNGNPPPSEESQEVKKFGIFAYSDFRDCPECGMLSIQGMPGGRDAVCKNCGYKDPCCYD